MKNLFIVTLLVVNISTYKVAYNQSIDETKNFITETIENNSLRDYTQNADFSANSTILNYHRCGLKSDGTIVFCMNLTFDVEGIKYIRDGDIYRNDGALTYKIIVYIKNGYACQEEMGATGNIKYSKYIEIYLDSKSELNKIKKALFHLSKLSGGTPSENDLFSD